MVYTVTSPPCTYYKCIMYIFDTRAFSVVPGLNEVFLLRNVGTAH
jgi:hypothetical protein